MEIRLKALQANSLLTIGEVADEAYWGNPADGDTDAANQLVYRLPATGYKAAASDTESLGRGVYVGLWSATQAGSDSAWGGVGDGTAASLAAQPRTAGMALRLVKASAEEVQVADQRRRNAALKVNMFTPFNAKTFDLSAKTISEFYDKLVVSFADCPTASYVTYEQLKEAGLTAADAVLTDGSGNEYRLPTEGELNLLLPMWTEPAQRDALGGRHWGVYHPWWNDNVSTNNPANTNADTYTLSAKVASEGWVETVYLKNGADGYPDKTDEASRFSGKSWMKKGALSETVHYYTATPDNAEKGNYDLAPVYGLRFQGTSQYAAYRWESCRIAANPLERYFSIKIKALKMDDTQIVIDDVADEAFWKDGFIEFKFPASGYYAVGVTPDASKDNISHRGVDGYCWASSLWSGAADGSQARYLHFNLNLAYVGHNAVGHRFPLRLVRVEE